MFSLKKLTYFHCNKEDRQGYDEDVKEGLLPAVDLQNCCVELITKISKLCSRNKSRRSNRSPLDDNGDWIYFDYDDCLLDKSVRFENMFEDNNGCLIENVFEKKWNDLTLIKSIVKNNHIECLTIAGQMGLLAKDRSGWLCALAARYGCMEFLRMAHERGSPWDHNTCQYAAKYGHISCLQYAHENGCLWSNMVCVEAARNGQLNALKYAHENGCPWDKWVCLEAARYGRLETLKYAHQNGCPCDELTSRAAAKRGNLECLKYLFENGCLCNELTVRAAAKMGHLECLKYLHESGCPSDIRTIWAAFEHRHRECYLYATNNMRPSWYNVNWESDTDFSE